uniref:NADH-ubiquinone oxidoreductase chain 6 n=1 Tax=Lentula callani TaxID=1260738 RepID=M4JCH9_9ORTH|nr:NADH dehydrogenase subunit 6 [Lentula callani]AGC22319.1 NADH dehydrogenase subunit 6 [Lentula callani]
MMKMLIFSISNILNINFMKLNHPMSMMMFIIMQTMSVCMMTGMMMESFWMSYMLFLTFLGGMLVLFIYISSIASNEMFYLKLKYFIWSMIILTVMMLTFNILNKSFLMEIIENSESLMMNLTINYQEMSLSLNKLYNNPTFIITMMLMVYLFLTLIAVVKITNINQGPIRKMK